MNIKLKNLDNTPVNSPLEIYAIMQRILMRESKIERNREHLWVISLDTMNQILNIELVSLGTVNKTIVEPMEVLSVPLQKKAVKIVMVHNHPSGHVEPSDKDLDVTDRILQAARIMRIQLIDHLIITEKTFYSFADSGLLKTLKDNSNYLTQYEVKEHHEKSALAIGVKQGMKDQLREIARTMKAQGFDVETIMKITGLPKATIVKLKVQE
jgi:DNA repair protein RadC